MQINQKGFSLIEILISLGILGIVVTAIVNLIFIQIETKKDSEGISDLVKVIGTLDGITREPLSCQNNFSGKTLNTKSILKSIVDEQNKILFKVGEPIFSGIYRLSDVSLGGLDKVTNRVEVLFEFTKLKKSQQNNIVTQKAYIYPTLKDGIIIDCMKNIQQKSRSLVNQICHNFKKGSCNLDSVLVEAKKRYCESKSWLTFDESTGKCSRLASQKICPTGLISGFSSDGQIICSNIIK